MERIVVVFDFDKTIIDVDSDNWVLDGLGFTDMFYELLNTMPWNSAMDMMMREMHQKGVKIGDIIALLQRIPIHPRIVPTIKAVHSAGCCLRIVSDANKFFIETILDHHGVRSYFSSIEANPGYVDDEEEGRLRIEAHQHDFANSPHGCANPNCPPNMCKGYVVERLISEQRNKKFIYLGDGKGDYCPMLRLREGDIVMPRKNFPVWDLISANPELLKGQVHGWSDGGELDSVLLNAIRTLASETPSEAVEKLVTAGTTTGPAVTHSYTTGLDCKRETVPAAASHEALPQAVSVPY